MKLSQRLIGSLSILSICVGTAFAADIMKDMVSAHDHIEGLDNTLAKVHRQTGVVPEFPAFIPKPANNKKYFASDDESVRKNGFTYMINVDSTKLCHGVRACNVGSVSAQPKTKVQMMTNRENKVITTEVMLADGTKAYFTPGHSMGDYFPATIQWEEFHTLYTISWNDGQKSAKLVREGLITMANSAKNPGSG